MTHQQKANAELQHSTEHHAQVGNKVQELKAKLAETEAAVNFLLLLLGHG